MEIHKPKPVHGWREFLKEVGTIVLGVLIAIGAEQTVEALHWRQKVQDAQDAIRLELRDDDGPQAVTRVAAEPCLDRELTEIQLKVEAGEDRAKIAALADYFRPPIRTWDAEAWKAAVASDVGSHASAERMIAWSLPYRVTPRMDAINLQESTDLTQLQVGRNGSGRLSPLEEDRILTAVQKLRSDNYWMAQLSRVLLVGIHKDGADPVPEVEAQILSGLRAHYGACVVTPSVTYVRPSDQLRSLHGG